MLRPLAVCFFISSVCAANVCTQEGPVASGCPISGNSDFYGLGVRLGIYSAWFASWIANNFQADEIIGTLDTNAIFLLVLFLTDFFQTVQDSGIRVIDVLIIQQMCIGFQFSVMSLWGYRTSYYKTEGPGGRRHFGGIGTHFRLILMGMISSYNAWFWIEGVEDGLSSCDRRTNCGGLDTFFFAPMKVEKWSTRSIHLAITLGAAIYYGIMALAAIGAACAWVLRRSQGKKCDWDVFKKEPDADAALTKREFTVWYFALSTFNLLWIIFAMVSIEVTLNLNHVTDVINFTQNTIGGPGQLIPAAIGIISLARVIFLLIREKMGSKKDGSRTEDIGTTSSSNSPYTQLEGRTPTIPSGTAPKEPMMSRQRRRPFIYRFIMAWLPWLAMFEWWRNPTALNSLAYAQAQRYEREREKVRDNSAARRVTNARALSDEDDIGLLSSIPSFSPGQTYSRARVADDVPMTSRTVMSDGTRSGSSMGRYESAGFDDYEGRGYAAYKP